MPYRSFVSAIEKHYVSNKEFFSIRRRIALSLDWPDI